MKIENDYPNIKKGLNKFLLMRKIILFTFLLSIIVVVIINLSVGGKFWMFYVIGAEIIFFYAFLNVPLIDNAIIKRITVVLFLICSYLYLIDRLNHTKWSYLVICILGFSIILIQLFFFFLGIKYQKRKLIVLFTTTIGSIIYTILAILKVFKLNWAIIVLGSLSLTILLMLIIFYRKLFTNELKKYFSLK